MPLFGGPPNVAALASKRDIEGLIKALTYKDSAVKIAAADALGPLRDPSTVEPLAALIQDSDVAVRRAAVKALSARGGVRVVAPLMAALQDADESVRDTASQAVYKRLMTDPDQDARRETVASLGRIKPAGALEPLIKAIMDPDEAIRVAAIKSLAAIGDCNAITPLLVTVILEQRRARTAGRSSLAVERAATQALDALCTPAAVSVLQEALGHDDPEVREAAVKRLAPLAKNSTTGAASTLEANLNDPDTIIARSAARGLLQIGWEPPNEDVAARYWATLREWGKCAQVGPAALPILVQALPDAPATERADILAGLGALGWDPGEQDKPAAEYWVSQHRWDKCVEVGAPAVEVLEGVIKSSPVWRDRVAAASALKELGQDRVLPFARLDVVQRCLAILDEDANPEDKRSRLTQVLTEEGLFEKPTKQSIGWCDCGYPTARVKKDGSRTLFEELLGADQTASSTVYRCPNCGVRQSTLI